MRRKYRYGGNKTAIILKTGRFDYIDSAVIISSVSNACTVLALCTALLALLMMTAESMLSKRLNFLRVTGFISSAAIVNCN